MTEQSTILVVEDEESFVEALVVGLKREGFLVKVARDGAEALSLFDIVRPDLVLLDVMLPRVSGIDVCRQLRKRSQVPIIMVTAKGAEIDTVVGLEVGADDYVTKPYRLRELIDRVWGPNYYGDTKTLDVHVKRLRAKVENDPGHPERIVTVRGVGYRYERV